ncbi:MAG: alpha/beta hydrolase family protein [Mycobacteriales bacterium]
MAGGRLAAEILIPATPGPHPVWLDVHAAGDGLRAHCTPRWQAMAPRGYAVVRWDKPGCGESTGDWRRQTVAVDRAREVLAVADAIRSMAEVDKHRLVTCGTGEGAWAVLAAAAIDAELLLPRLAAAVTVGAAVRLTDREEHRLRHELPERYAASSADVGEALGLYRRQAGLIRCGQPMSRVEALAAPYRDKRWYDGAFGREAGWDFTARNLELDPVPWLSRIRCPVLSLWGGQDLRVDVRASRSAYAAGLGRRLTAQVFPGADHGLRVCAGDEHATSPGVQTTIAAWSARAVAA